MAPEIDDLIGRLARGDRIDWQAVVDASPDARAFEHLRLLDRLFSAFAAHHHEAGPDVPSADGERSTPERWGTLLVHESIGRGAGSTVYRAHDPRLRRDVALKLLDDEVLAASSRATLTSSERADEGRHLARIRHPNVVTVYGVDEHDGRTGLWMELIEGVTLDAFVKVNGTLSPREAVVVVIDVCDALTAVHGAGLLHRDVKAANVMRAAGGRIVLMDMGAGREVADGTTASDLAGTPLYMAPELFEGASAAPQTDVYSTGVLLFYLLTGTYPVVGHSVGDLKAAHRAGRRTLLEDARPGLPSALIDIVRRATAHDAKARFQSAGEMRAALRAGLLDDPEPAAQPTGAVARRRSWRPWVAGAALLALGVVIGAWVATRTGVARPSTAAGTTPQGRPLSHVQAPPPYDSQRLAAALAFENLAGEHAARSEWQAAYDAYDEAYKLFELMLGPDAPATAFVNVQTALMKQRLGAADVAQSSYEVSSFTLVQEVGAAHPYNIVTLVALASLFQETGRADRATETLARAVAAQRDQLRSLGFTPRGPGLTRAALAQGLAQGPLARDQDEDWLPDALEVALGTSPTAADSDGNGVADGAEDADDSGIPDGWEYGLPWDPTAVVAHYGAYDPIALGYHTYRPLTGRASASGSAWDVEVDQQSYYYRPLTRVQKQRALERGFRLWVSLAAQRGGAYVVTDLSPPGGRFDFWTEPSGGGQTVRLTTSVVPLEGTVSTRTSPYVFGVLDYDPRTRTSRVTYDDGRIVEGYGGHRQFLEQRGLQWGPLKLGGSADGAGEFGLVNLQIR